MLCYAAWRREFRLGESGRPRDARVYALGLVLTSAFMALFFAAPLPPGVLPEFVIHRPEELVPAALFVVALVGFLRKGDWTWDPFEHWLVLSLIVNIVAQSVYMPLSSALFDPNYFAAHVLKGMGYTCLLVGLFASMYATFRQVEEEATERRLAEQALRENEIRFRSVIDTMADGLIIMNRRGTIESFNPEAEEMFGLRASEVVGQRIEVLMPEPYRSEHARYVSTRLQRGERPLRSKREAEGRRADGTVFPIEISVSEVVFENELRFAGLVRDISERKHSERVKDEFVSTVSHELRTPLTAIRGSLGLLVGGVSGQMPRDMARLVRVAHDNCVRLINLINDLLDIQKIASGRMAFEMRPQPLLPLIQQAIEGIRSYADQFRVAVSLEVSPDRVHVTVDSQRLLQVLSNLLSNAIKFSPPGQRVDVRVRQRGASVRVSVTDRGPGIPVEFRPHIFERFAQADASDTKQRGGTGLGLAICRSLIERMDGRIDFETRLGIGSNFYFDLPAWEAQGRGQRQRPRRHSWTNNAPRLLVCEQDPERAARIAAVLERSGYRADLAHSLGEAKELLASRMYAAMTMSAALPDLGPRDALAFVGNLRDREDTADLPVVILGHGYGPPPDPESLPPMTQWLSGPVDEGSLARAVDRVSGRVTGPLRPVA